MHPGQGSNGGCICSLALMFVTSRGKAGLTMFSAHAGPEGRERSSVAGLSVWTLHSAMRVDGCDGASLLFRAFWAVEGILVHTAGTLAELFAPAARP